MAAQTPDPPQTTCESVEVFAPARLHLGFLDISGTLGRHFGSLGLTIEGIGTRVRLARATQPSAAAHIPERAARLLASLSERHAELLEHPAVRDCGVVPLPDRAAGEIPCAFIVLRDGGPGSAHLAQELSAYVAERLTSYKQPREVRFVASIPRNPSGKILRRNLRDLL